MTTEIMIFINISIFLIILNCTFCPWISPCERIINPSSYDDCKGKSTEFVYEACCFLKGVDDKGEEESECIDIERDHIRYDKNLNETKEKIINGTYWDSYNFKYTSIEILRCDNNYIYAPVFLLFLLILL